MLSVVVNGPLRTLTVNATDRSGAPATGPVDLWSAETGEWRRIWIEDGTVSEQVPDGLWTVMAVVEPGDGDGDFPYEQTVVGDPEVQIDGDITFDFDARDGKPVRIDTPRACGRRGLRDVLAPYRRRAVVLDPQRAGLRRTASCRWCRAPRRRPGPSTSPPSGS